MSLIPDAATKRHMAILGTNGSGKTSVAKSQIVEPALAAGERVCCIDPTGVMWGVRLGANGKPKGGFPIYIVGGEHADFPLTKRDGKVWAEIVGTTSDSFIFDTSLMTVADRTSWFTDFAETLIRKNKGPLRLIEDEAHLFAPQGGAKAGGLAPDMLHAANNLLALGRSKGLRITMISQRPAKLHKDSLSQAHTLVAMKLIAPQDRNAIKDWVADQTEPEYGKELIASLPTLKPGEGWVWAPADGILDRMQFPLPKTYDSSRAPDEDQGEGPALSPIDPAAIQSRLAEVAAEAIANDPAKLRAEITRLGAELAKAHKAAPAPAPVDPTAIQDAEARGWNSGVAAAFEAMAPAAIELRTAVDQSLNAVRKLAEVSQSKLTKAVAKVAASRPMPARNPVSASPPRQSPPKDTGDLGGPRVRILNSLATWKAMGFDTVSNAQCAWLAGYSPAGSAYKNPRGALKAQGLVDYPSPDDVQITSDGETLATAIDINGSLYEFIAKNLGGPERRIMDSIHNLGGGPASNAAVASGAMYSADGSAYKNPRGALKTKGLIFYPAPDMVALAEWLK